MSELPGKPISIYKVEKLTTVAYYEAFLQKIYFVYFQENQQIPSKLICAYEGITLQKPHLKNIFQFLVCIFEFQQ